MKKLVPLLMMLATLALPASAWAQPDGDRTPTRERGERAERLAERLADRRAERDGPRHDRHRRGEPITVEMIEPAIATLRAMHPDAKIDWLDRLEQLAKDKPEEAARRLSRYPRLRELIHAREHRPAEFELYRQQSTLMRQVFPLVRKVRQAAQEEDQATIDELRPQIRQRIESLFQIRMKLKEREIERIRQDLRQAEQELKDIEADSQTLIDQKMNELMQRAQSPRGKDDAHQERKRPE